MGLENIKLSPGVETRFFANPSQDQSQNQKTVLVIEDDPDLLDVITIYFDPNFWQVRVAKDLKEARTIILTSPIELVLADYRLPDGLATELFQECKKVCSNFILMTGDFEVESVARSQGIENFIQKPFRKSQIQELLLMSERSEVRSESKFQ